MNILFGGGKNPVFHFAQGTFCAVGCEGQIVGGNPENAIERSALSTCVGLLGREAIYTGRDVTWQSYVGPMI